MASALGAVRPRPPGVRKTRVAWDRRRHPSAELGQELAQAQAGDGVLRLDLRRDQELVRSQVDACHRSSPNFEATVATYQKDVAEFFSDAALESDVSRAVPQHLLVLGCNRADLSDETEQMNGEVWHAALAIVWVALGRVWARALPASAATGLGFVLFTCHLLPMLPIEGVRNLRRRRRGATSRRKSRRNRFFRAARARKWAFPSGYLVLAPQVWMAAVGLGLLRGWRPSAMAYICSVGLVIWRLALVRAGPEAAGRSLRSSAPADHRHVTSVTGRF